MPSDERDAVNPGKRRVSVRLSSGESYLNLLLKVLMFLIEALNLIVLNAHVPEVVEVDDVFSNFKSNGAHICCMTRESQVSTRYVLFSLRAYLGSSLVCSNGGKWSRVFSFLPHPLETSQSLKHGYGITF